MCKINRNSIKNNKILLVPAIVILCLCFFTGFSNDDSKKYIEELLEARTSIIQQCIYNEISKAEGEKALNKIETYPILTEDIKSLREWENTQIDVVEDMHILSLEEIQNTFNYKTFKAEIMWNMNGLSEKYIYKGIYHVVIKKIGNEYYISSISLID